jgi:hypothetical protein
MDAAAVTRRRRRFREGPACRTESVERDRARLARVLPVMWAPKRRSALCIHAQELKQGLEAVSEAAGSTVAPFPSSSEWRAPPALPLSRESGNEVSERRRYCFSSRAGVRRQDSATLACVHERRSAPRVRQLTTAAPELHGTRQRRWAAAFPLRQERRGPSCSGGRQPPVRSEHLPRAPLALLVGLIRTGAQPCVACGRAENSARPLFSSKTGARAPPTSRQSSRSSPRCSTCRGRVRNCPRGPCS